MVNNNTDACNLHRFKDVHESARWVHPPSWWPWGVLQGRLAGGSERPCRPALQVVRYEAGYVVCAVIAGLYLLVVPTAGLCFCCCRGHQRCGGPAKTEYKEMACERGTLMTFLLLTTLVLL